MITVTAASGHLGRLVLTELLDRGVPPEQIVAAVRTPEKVDDLASRGIQVRFADYDQPQTLTSALADTSKLLFISGSEVGQRIEQHRNVVEAAQAAGVGLLAYTSILKGDTSSVPLAVEHLATERLIRASGLPFVLLRNGWYVENYTEAALGPAVDSGTILGAAGTGRVAAATRRTSPARPPPSSSTTRPPTPRPPTPRPRTRPARCTNSAPTSPSPWPNWRPRSAGRAAVRSPTRTYRPRRTPRP
ncbi:NAD(P)H-binding protein [Solwaraspora sp. WMMD406]|uniref:NAD(P)H-binding protein n=1 Tax=Solwaraspora sp. WMMD406 TaxID=3016095 RepID=UPI0032429018